MTQSTDMLRRILEHCGITVQEAPLTAYDFGFSLSDGKHQLTIDAELPDASKRLTLALSVAALVLSGTTMWPSAFEGSYPWPRLMRLQDVISPPDAAPSDTAIWAAQLLMGDYVLDDSQPQPVVLTDPAILDQLAVAHQVPVAVVDLWRRSRSAQFDVTPGTWIAEQIAQLPGSE